VYARSAEVDASAILPPWCRKSPAITEVLPLLYPHGLSTGDFALDQFLGTGHGLLAPVITKLRLSLRKPLVPGLLR
jgi:hypothetical protein